MARKPAGVIVLMYVRFSPVHTGSPNGLRGLAIGGIKAANFMTTDIALLS
jgi:hypothetical protein